MSSNTIINGDVNSPITFSSPITTTIESGLLTINSNTVSPNTITCNNIMDSSSDSGNLIFNANTIMIKDGIYSTNTNTSSSYSGNINVNANTIIIGNTVGNAQVNGDLSIQNNINSLSNNTVTINANLKVVGNITTQLSINNNLLVSGDVNVSGGITFNDNTRQTTAFNTLSPNPSNTYINPSSIVINDKGQVTSAIAGTALTPGSYTNTSITVGTNGQISLIGNGTSGGGGGSSSGGRGPVSIFYKGPLPYYIPDNIGTDVMIYVETLTVSSNNSIILPNGIANGFMKIIITRTQNPDLKMKLYGPTSPTSYNNNFIRWGTGNSNSYTNEYIKSCDLMVGDQLCFNIVDVNGIMVWALYSQSSRPMAAYRPEYMYNVDSMDQSYIGYRYDKTDEYSVNYTNFVETISGRYNYVDVYLYRKTDFFQSNPGQLPYQLLKGVWSISWEFKIWDDSGTLNKNCNIFVGLSTYNSVNPVNSMFLDYGGFSNGAELKYQMWNGVPPGSYYMGNYNITPLNNPGTTHTFASYSGCFPFTSSGATNFHPFIAFGNQARFSGIRIVCKIIAIRIG